MSGQTGVQSLERAFALVEQLARNPEGMQLMELAEATGLHKSTVHRLLASLAGMGYVRQAGETGKYALTLKLFELSGRVVDSLDVLQVARPHLEQLRNATREAVHLVVREENDIVYVYKAESKRGSIRMFSRIGMRRAMYCTGVGKSILANLPDREVEEIWRASPVSPHTPHTIVTLNGLLEELEQVRQRGYALDNEENELGVRCIAAALRDYTGRTRAAFSISAPISHMSDERIAELAPQVLEAAEVISGELGWRKQNSGATGL